MLPAAINRPWAVCNPPSRGGSAARCVKIVCAMALLVAWAQPAAAQVFELKGGTSTLFNAQGGSVQIYGGKYTSRFSLGFADKTRFGLFLEFPYRHMTWGIGDQNIPFALPTDLFNRSYYFTGRGLSASRKNKHSTLFIFAGATSRRYSVPFFDTTSADRGAGLVFYDRQLGPSLRFFSHNVLTSRQTSIQSFEWKPREKLVLAVAGGMGSNQPFGSSSLELTGKRVSLRAGYTLAGRAFRRVQVVAPVMTETDRENVRLELTPLKSLRFSFNRQNYLSPPSASGAGGLRATVNGASAAVVAGGFQLHGSLFGSASHARRSPGISLGLRRDLGSRINAGVNYLRSMQAGGRVTESQIATLREKLTRRLSLSQVISHSGGRTSVAYGGNVVWNRVTLGVDYQTVFLPFAPLGRSQFQQVAVVNFQVQLPWNILLGGSSHVDPLGKVRYTAYTDAFVYHTIESAAGVRAPRGTFAKNVIQGRVEDEKGQPVSGAALKIDTELVFTDSQGAFLMRRKHAREYPLQVLLDQFMFPGVYEVVSAPKTVKAAPEERAETYKVVLRRVR